YLEINPNCDYTAIEDLEKLNESLKGKLQELVDANAAKADNEILNEKAKAVEVESLRIFGTLNSLKKQACKNK
ncbi:MAG: hypothetical protein HWD90_13410, partial [Campylobacteraceae bacterium]|nr:hypothetical protein [Campylobacteraceae bacterium]